MDKLKKEIELSESWRSATCKKCIRLLDVLFSVGSLELSQDQCKQEDSLNGKVSEGVIKVAIFLKSKSKSYRREKAKSKRAKSFFSSNFFLRDSFFRSIYALTAFYGTIKFAIAFVVQFEFERISRSYMHLLCNSTSITNQCCTPNSVLPFKNDKYRQKIEFLGDLVYWVGNPLAEVPGLSILSPTILSSFALVCYVISMMLWHVRKTKVDYLAFIINPLSEVKRIEAVLEQISLDVFESFLNSCGKTVCDCGISRPISLDAASKDDDKCDSYGQFNDYCGSKEQETIMSKRSFVKLVPSVSRNVQPPNLDPEWHVELTNKIYYGQIYSVLLVGVFSISCSIGVLLLSLYWSYRRRTAFIRCEQELPSSKPIEFVHTRTPDGINLMLDEELGMYLNQELTFFELLHLLVYVESKYYYTVQNVLMIVELFITVILMSIWNVAVWWMYSVGVLDKAKWINQVQRQLKECIKLQGNSKEDSDYEKLLRMLLTSYLNYNLFKSQFQDFRYIANVILGQIVGISISIIMGAYLSKYSRAELDTFSMLLLGLGFIYLLLLTNIFFVIGSYLFARIERSMRCLIQILAHHNTLPKSKDKDLQLGLDFIIKSWHKQLLDYEELTKFFAFKCINIRVSYDKLLPINAYSFATTAIIMKR